MIIDTSAVLAILFQEAAAPQYAQVIAVNQSVSGAIHQLDRMCEEVSAHGDHYLS